MLSNRNLENLTLRPLSQTLSLVLLSLALASFVTAPADAGIIVVAQEVAGDVVMTGSGFADPTGLDDPTESAPGLAGIYTDGGTVLALGPIPDANVIGDIYTGSFSGPDRFGTPSTSPIWASSGTGDLFGLGGTTQTTSSLLLPLGYEAGSPLASEIVFEGANFGDLGLVPGTLEWQWGDGNDGQRFTFQVVPEPTTGALLGLGLLAMTTIGPGRLHGRA